MGVHRGGTSSTHVSREWSMGSGKSRWLAGSCTHVRGDQNWRSSLFRPLRADCHISPVHTHVGSAPGTLEGTGKMKFCCAFVALSPYCAGQLPSFIPQPHVALTFAAARHAIFSRHVHGPSGDVVAVYTPAPLPWAQKHQHLPKKA